MIQFNLLPDVKIQFIRAKRLKRTVVSVAVVAAGASLFLLILLFLAVDVFQKKHISDLNKDIKNDSAKIQSIGDITKVLTIQNQLISLPALHDAKPVTSRLSGYLHQLVPVKATISQLEVDFDNSTMTITGDANSLVTVNKFIDTLKFTTYTTTANTTATNAFSKVVLSDFSRTSDATNYTIQLNFDPAIFNSANTISLKVPNIITTRSETERPTDLFQTPTNTGTQ